jgi:hypothetical protein
MWFCVSAAIRRLSVPLIGAAALTVPAPAAHADPLLLGRTVQYQYLAPDLCCVNPDASNGNHLVGAGIEIANVANRLATLDISDTNLYVDFIDRESAFYDAPFNGFRITDVLGQIPSFTSVMINPATNMAGLPLPGFLGTATTSM